MGARTNIELRYKGGNSVFIYSHWGGGDDGSARRKLYAALNRHERWDDDMYLGAIIMREMFRDNLDDETGYGVQPFTGAEEYSTTVVQMDQQTVDGAGFQQWLDDNKYLGQ